MHNVLAQDQAYGSPRMQQWAAACAARNESSFRFWTALYDNHDTTIWIMCEVWQDDLIERSHILASEEAQSASLEM